MKKKHKEKTLESSTSEIITEQESLQKAPAPLPAPELLPEPEMMEEVEIQEEQNISAQPCSEY